MDQKLPMPTLTDLSLINFLYQISRLPVKVNLWIMNWHVFFDKAKKKRYI